VDGIFFTTTATLYSQDGDSSKSYGSADYSNGVVYGSKLSKGKITFYKNGKSLGLAYTLKDKKLEKKLIPCIDCYYQNQSLELVKGKFKN